MSAEKVLRDVYFSSPMADPGASGTITVDRSPAYVPLDSAAAETRTLAAPSKAGALVTIAMRVDTGDITLTVTGNYNEAGDSTFVFSDPGQFVTFQSVESAAGTFVWRKLTDYGAGNVALAGLTSNVTELNRLDDSLATNSLSRGTGVDTAESYAAGISRAGTLITTEIVVDLSTLIGSATDLDIIGESAAANCNWGQITTAKCGTLIGGKVECLELPAGGADDIDFYSSNVATGTQDVIITDAALGTETALVTSGGAWASGTVKGMTGLPTANDYIYIVNGEAAGGTYTAGKFRITLYGLGS
jgi:hypothetical protein